MTHFTQEELKVIIVETVRACNDENNHTAHYRKSKAKKMEFSKKLILGALFFIGALCVLSLLSWFFTGDWPQEIVEYFAMPFVSGMICIAGYFCKSAYENKAKIEKGEDV